MKFGVVTSLLLLTAKFATSADPYLSGVQRSELFELTDFKVPKFEITITDEEFTTLKQSVNKKNNDGSIDENDPCAAVKATRKLLNDLGVDIEEMGRHTDIPGAPSTSKPGEKKEEKTDIDNGNGKQDPISAIMKLLQDNKVVSDAIAAFKKMMDKSKLDPARIMAVMKMIKNGHIDEQAVSEFLHQLGASTKVTELALKIVDFTNKKIAEQNRNASNLIKMLQDSKIVNDTMMALKRFLARNNIDPTRITDFMKNLQNGGIDAEKAAAILNKLKLPAKVNDFLMKIIKNFDNSPKAKEEKSDAIMQILKDNNVDAATMATFKRLMDEGKIDPNNTMTILKMTLGGTVSPDTILSYMKNLNIDPEVIEVFTKVMNSTHGNASAEVNKEEEAATLIKMLEEGGIDAETVATFKSLVEAGKVDPTGTISFLKMMQSGTVDPESSAAYMKNLNLEPEVYDVFLKVMQTYGSSKPKEYPESQPIYETFAKLVFTLDEEHVQTFDKVKFGISGASSLFNYKPSFKINIKEKKDLYGVKNLKLKADVADGSMLNTKIVSDLRLKSQMIVPQANYAEVYINGKYMGLYVMTETFKKQWAIKKYNVEEVTNLYKCDNGKLTFTDSYNGCENESKKASKSEWEQFLKTLDAAKTEKDIEDIFDVEGFLRNAAFDYLNGSIDHYTAGAYHNFYMIKPSEGAKWEYLPFDFDNDFYAYNYEDKKLVCNTGVDILNYFEKNAKLNQLLIFSNPERLEKMIMELVDTIWNPVDLYERINQLKEFLSPYMMKDRAVEANGHVAGYINEQAQLINHENTFDEWSNFVEFTSSTAFGCGLKRWIVEKYRYVCGHRQGSCDAEKLAYAKSIQYTDEFIDQVESEEDRMKSGTGNGHAGIGDAQASVTMEEQYNIFKVCDSVDIFYVMANYYGWDYSKMVIDPETGLAVTDKKDITKNNSTTDAEPSPNMVQRSLKDIEKELN